MSKPITLRSTTFNTWRINTNSISKSVGDVDHKVQNDSVAEATIGNLAQHASVTLTPTLTSGATTATISTVGIQLRPGMDVLSTAFDEGTSVASVDYATGVITFSNQANDTGAISVTFNKSTTSILNDIELRKIDKSGDIVTGDFGVLGNVTLGNSAADDHVITGQLAINQAVTGTEVFQVTGNTKITGNETITGNLTVDGNTTLGNAVGDTITLNAKAVSIPNSLSFDSDLLYIDSTNDRIGIRTSAPYATLTIQTKDTDISNDARGIVLEQADNTLAFSQAKFIGARSRGTSSSPSAILVNDAIVSFDGRGYKATTWSNTVGGLYVYAAENWTDTATGSYLTLRGVAIGGTAVSEWIKFTSTTTTINAATASTTTSTGALVVTGGVGIGGAANIGGICKLTSGTVSTSSITGALVVTGGVGVSQNIYVAGTTNLAGNTAITGTSTFSTGTGTATFNGNTSISGTNTFTVGTGATSLGGGLTVTGTADFNGAVTIDGASVNTTISPTGTGTVTINPATAGTINNMSIGATTRSTGAFTTLVTNSTTTFSGATSVAGTNTFTVGTGATSLGGTLGIVGDTSVTSATASTSSITGALKVTGGVGIGGALWVAGAVNPASIAIQTTGTFSSGTGTNTFNGATSVAGTNTFTVGAGATTLGGSLTVTGTADFNGDVTINGAGVSTTISPTGLGTVTVNPATAGAINNMSIGATTRSTGAFTTLVTNSTTTFSGATSVAGTNTFTVGTGLTSLGGALTVTGTADFNGAVTIDGASVNTTISPTGTGTVTINPATAGIIDNMSIGATTRSTGAFTTLVTNSTTTFSGTTSVAGTNTFTVGTGATALGGTLAVTGATTISSSTVSTSSITGALKVTGGVGIGGALWVAGAVNPASILIQTTGTFSSGTGTNTFNGNTSISGTKTFTVGTGATSLGGGLTVTGVATFNGDTVCNADVYLGNASTDVVNQLGTLKLAAGSKLQVGASGDTVNSILMTDASGGVPVLRSLVSTDGTISFVIGASANGTGTIDIKSTGVIPSATTFQDDVTFGDAVSDRVIFTGYIDGPVHIGTSAGGGTFVDQYPFYSSSAVTPTAVNVAILPSATYRAVEYFIQATNGTNYYTTKLVCVHNGTTTSVTEYATIKIGTWGTFDFTADISTGNIILSYTSAPAGTTVVKTLATAFRA